VVVVNGFHFRADVITMLVPHCGWRWSCQRQLKIDPLGALGFCRAGVSIQLPRRGLGGAAEPKAGGEPKVRPDDGLQISCECLGWLM